MLSKAVRLLASSPQEVMGRIRQRLHSTSEQLLPKSGQARLPRNSTALDIVRAAAASSEIGFFSGPSSPNCVAELRRFAPLDEASVTLRAEKIARGYVPIFGHGWVNVGSPPKWQTEPVSGKTAPNVHWSRVPYLKSGVVGDHKVLWEFNRHQHFVVLAQAARYTGAAEWSLEIRSQLDDWIDTNPASRGVNWASSLEVAYRAISWCWTLRLLGAGGVDAVFDEKLATRFLNSVIAHGRHISRFLSTWFSPNTHLTGEALGLVYLGTLFPALSGASTWLRVGRAILENEVVRQVRPDGVYFEQASQYHRYTLEIYLHFVLLSRASGHCVSPQVEEAVHRQFNVLLALSRADGSMALIGDDDGGRLLQLDEGSPDMLAALFAIGAVALDRKDLAKAGQGADAALIWTMGPGAVGKRDRLAAEHRGGDPTASAFPAGGLYTIRDSWLAPSGHATISCGPHGSLSSGHAHADALAVELYSASGPVFVDKGTFCYDGVDRNRFRSTAAHNTLEFAGRGASEPSTPFRWLNTTDAQLDAWWHGHGATWFQGHHDGYDRIRNRVRHTRSVWHPVSGCWLIWDDVNHAHELPVAVRWHAAPGLQIHSAEQWQNTREIHVNAQGEGRLATLVLDSHVSATVTTADDEVSSQYGMKLPAETVTWSGTAPGPLRVTSLIIDWKAFTSDAIRVMGLNMSSEIVVDNGRGSHDSRDDLPVLDLRGTKSTFDIGSLSVRAKATCYLPSRDNTSARLVAIGVRASHDFDERASVSAENIDSDRWTVAERHGDGWTVNTGTIEASET